MVRVDLPFGVIIWVGINADEPIGDIEMIGPKLKDLREPMQALADHMRSSFRQNFVQGGRPDKWAPLANGTIAGRIAARGRFSRLRQALDSKPGYGGRLKRVNAPLVDKGELMASYTTRGYNHTESVSQTGMTTGSTNPVAAIHEYGTGLYGSKGREYTIRPRRAKALRFIGQNGPSFAKSVNHPGVKPRPVAVIQPEDVDKAVQLIVDHSETI